MMRFWGAWIAGLAAALIALSAQPAAAQMDLSRSSVSRLPNGLTVMILEDHTFPVVSVQMLYKSGAADEVTGKTGLAHFLEHLAFRSSKYFPNAAATEAIYDAGGEWHGYTWLNQTTYFATAPKERLDLLLRIEADRMANVIIDPAAIEAERGAVLAEMHGYENDPTSVLLDAVTAAALQVHTYRNNTIGLEADVERLTLGDFRDFYDSHYSPANAVLTIVGDVQADGAYSLVEQHFREISPKPAPRRIASPEPAQRGERRVELNGPVDRRFFALAYPAPAASNPDVPAFLVMQQLLAAGSGFNFNQNDWGTPAAAGSLLHGVTGDLATWFIPTADRYIFTIKGSIAGSADARATEREIERSLQSLRAGPPTEQRLAAAKAAVLDQLAADVETTEDAAHQLAYMTGVGGYDMLIHLPERVRAVTAEDLWRVASAYLAPNARTVGWYVPGAAGTRGTLGAPVPSSPPAQSARPARTSLIPPPQMRRLSNGLPVIIQHNSRTPTVTVQLVISAPVEGADIRPALPGLGVVTRTGNSTDLAALVAEVKAASAKPVLLENAPARTPEAKLEEMIAAEMRLPTAAKATPLLAVVSGSVEPATATTLLAHAFGNDSISRFAVRGHDAPRTAGRRSAGMERPFAQGALGYVVAAPPPARRDALAWKMLLYILSHDYSGRLGRSAIGEMGLAYHIDSAYRSDRRSGWITLTTGVDPAKADALEAEFRSQLARLDDVPPTEVEVAAARSHLLGRAISAAQSNPEIADQLTAQHLQGGVLLTPEELRSRLQSIDASDLAAIAKEFGKGTVLRVDVDPATELKSGR